MAYKTFEEFDDTLDDYLDSSIEYTDTASPKLQRRRIIEEMYEHKRLMEELDEYGEVELI
ncbi:PA3496 family putative envelope integrity protein [Legionella sp. W05-934-2]|jgi:hypothetical protein|uniref:PA3496 family putative envelope integrity protein n=1 Tax=Legionella sp. W05-934-2 TaxID=1198649 RepID=UPI003462BC02